MKGQIYKRLMESHLWYDNWNIENSQR